MIFLATSCKKDFLDIPPVTGLTDDKLIDLPAMKALIDGAYATERGYAWTSTVAAALMVRDVKVDNNVNYPQFFDHQIANDFGLFVNSYTVLGLLNTVAVSDVQKMAGTKKEKDAIMGDMHFLRALIYFDLNNYFQLPSTGYSVPLVKAPIGVNDKVSTAKTVDVMNFIEEDIEAARTNFKDVSGVANYHAATALAARIYFFHKKYDKAYQMANEVINSGKYIIENNVSAPFTPNAASRENIFSFVFKASDGAGYLAPTLNLFTAYQSNNNGFLSLYPPGELAQLKNGDPNDARVQAFYYTLPNITYIDYKYQTDQMDFPYIRLAEMYLTRAEANIIKNNAVSQQDVDDVNMLRRRANPATILNNIPSVNETLDIIYNDRTKEMAIELGDHYLNVRRLQRGIVKIPSEGVGLKPYSEYADLLAFPFPQKEIGIYGLTRRP